jgi:hypothetical protein
VFNREIWFPILTILKKVVIPQNKLAIMAVLLSISFGILFGRLTEYIKKVQSECVNIFALNLHSVRFKFKLWKNKIRILFCMNGHCQIEGSDPKVAVSSSNPAIIENPKNYLQIFFCHS